MVYGFVMDVPAPIEFYDALHAEIARLATDGVEGLLVHVGRATRDGFQVTEIWTSKEQCDRFNQEVVGPALARLSGLDGPVVVDLGSGSGAIALSIAHEHPGARVTAVERDPGALAWTRHNALARAGARDTPVGVVAGDMTDPALLTELDGRVEDGDDRVRGIGDMDVRAPELLACRRRAGDRAPRRA